MALPMGTSKTLISLVLALKQTKNSKAPILIVCSKTLIENWKHEIHKFFGDSLEYDILHQDVHKNIESWVLAPATRVIITTADVVSKYYTKKNIENKFVTYDVVNPGAFNQYRIARYLRPTEPFINNVTGPGILFSIRWGCFIVDEIQKYTKITTSQRSKGLAAICASHRWGLSGTMFDEPVISRILGYYMIIDHPTFPRTLPCAISYVGSTYFPGVMATVVYRKSNDAFNPPKLNEIIVSHDLSEEEEKVYMAMKITLTAINKEVRRLRLLQDTDAARRFSSYLLAIITYLRQSIVCPLLPIANIALDMSDYENKSKLSNILLQEIRKLNIDSWLNNPENVVSSRIRRVIDVIDKHPDERLVVFMCFRTCLDIFHEQIKGKERPIFSLNSTMSTSQRGKVLDEFAETDTGILLLTYELGGEGLNLQASRTVLLIDLWWNAGKTQQSIARVLRFGQTSDTVDVYYFTSNTGIENAVFEKHLDKLVALESIKTGPMTTGVKTMSTDEIIEIIENSENRDKLQNINQMIRAES